MRIHEGTIPDIYKKTCFIHGDTDERDARSDINWVGRMAV
jgi:hypothetical protein